ncbi:endolytic transglycosylase MltG [Streptomyces albidoflavus]|uniref:endolytic transglycosylase MltG n=1 Tax=Streptomyces albidoflavus TaxID=1886 RepID=UPI00101E5EE9|nr:endolytic transglycosylase MltG [Streptomyces albidoflavus]RZF01314.1 endolytic transglycosylase MltG [Streptomyces albidoflavus]RZF03184.1 endolytic transglycosylase MltG [Streptomyces albidoflavus]
MPHDPRRRSPRLTGRGRLALLTAGLLAAVAVAAAVVLLRPDDGETPRDLGSLTVPEGRRATQVYALADQALGLAAGTTRQAAKDTRLALPAAADGNPEGYLFPATYPLDDSTTPATLLAFMADTADERFRQAGLDAGALRLGLSAYQAVTLASIVQAEADTPADMGKVARVIHNRLDQDRALEMDSTLNYALGRTSLDTTHEDTRTDSPYNTYARPGLPPTPIGNPGEQALRAALDPPAGGWLYFVTVRPGDTRFSEDYAEHRANVEEFNRERAAEGEG